MPLASIPSPPEGVWYLGPVPLRAYALCIMLGVVVAVWLGERRWRARGGAPGTIIDLAVWAVPFGLVGGRLYHVISDWQLYFGPDAPNEPIEALFIWNGGLGIWGAVALGGVGVWIACRRRGISLSAVADTIAPGIVIAQAIGRWGNYFNQELFGGPTDLPWALEIEPGRPGTIPGEATYHPAFLYESIWDLGLGLALIWIGSRFALRHGRLFALYVAGYTVGRFWIEGLRVDPANEILGMRLNQWTSIVLFIGAVAYFWLTRNKSTEESLGVVPDPGDDVDPAHTADQADADAENTATGSGKDDDAPHTAAAAAPDPAHDGDQADEESAGERAEVASAGVSPDPAHDDDQADEESAGERAEVASAGVSPDPAHDDDQADEESAGERAEVASTGVSPDPAHDDDQADKSDKAPVGAESEAGKK
ncbi:prolipoprotein diacylglyceryl transferase [Streptosporangium sp. KLBMP 9127]|nr:prolipoprotein diacylglyceryl transferase [Streptosporangium sp. KLBMP 9127]